MHTPQSTSFIDLTADEPLSNTSGNAHFSDLLATRISRRRLLGGGGALAAALTIPGLLSACSTRPMPAQSGLLGFDAIPALALDTITVPAGYTTQTLLPWGTPLLPGAATFKADASNTAAEQAQQIGSHHDGMHFFPIDFAAGGNSSTEGLLVMNHEYCDPDLLHTGGAQGLPRPLAQVEKELAAHGISVAHIRLDNNGQWQLVSGSRFNRRITGSTVMEMAGPLRGHASMKTLFSPDGSAARGTLNNCSMGVTPWGTYLTCEENWSDCFINRDAVIPRSQYRYGIRADNSKYHWHTAQPQADISQRFDATATADSAAQDYRNEPHQFGWIVEIDPFNPASTPRKHTAMGRFAHEGIIFHPAVEGQPLVAYSGDDSRFEYIYKFVSREPYFRASAGSHLLEQGTLYVAVFHDDGRGEWRALDIHNAEFQQRAAGAGVTFADQADVLLNTRLAADVAGATKMDRPEWGAVHPHTGEVYFTLTNNDKRRADQTDAANPRAHNQYGHIIRWREQGAPQAQNFEWDVFWFGGPAGTAQPQHQTLATTASEIACPDGLRFDADGRLWIQTDISNSSALLGSPEFGHNGMYAADPHSGELRRFLSGPNGCEVTGVVSTPDQTTLFVNIQHPGEGSTPTHFTSQWPDGGKTRPRSATVAIRRINGGKIGA
ncbi:MAG: PhoX family phosphatase [Saccharospirillaceae bacterium]|nr:PhoX family phosphatase [Saccharospirillaceae bacterium]MCD8533234.1 PhoX family phosphatase [Saccharospirillaceae bacterium]